MKQETCIYSAKRIIGIQMGGTLDGRGVCRKKKKKKENKTCPGV